MPSFCPSEETASKPTGLNYGKYMCFTGSSDNGCRFDAQLVLVLLVNRLGYRMGMCAVLGLWVCWDCVWGFVASGTTTIGGRTAFPVFRACGGLLILQWFWGCSVFIWTRFRVNYIYLFDFDPRIVNSPLALFNEAVDNTLFFLLCMLLYYKVGFNLMIFQIALLNDSDFP